MATATTIEWTDHTFNPWIGCTRVGTDCKNCYAAAWAHRFKKDCWGDGKPRIATALEGWELFERWHRQALEQRQPAKVFCGSLCDVFEDATDPAVERGRALLFQAIAAYPGLIFQLVTKRPENIRVMVPQTPLFNPKLECLGNWLATPPYHVWYLCSVGDQRTANKRLPAFIETPAWVRGVSAEPLLGPLSLRDFYICRRCPERHREGLRGVGCVHCAFTGLNIQWLVIGGESGFGARPCYLDWVRDLVEEAKRFGVAVFVKQLGRDPWQPAEWHEDAKVAHVPLVLDHPKGGDPSEWPGAVPPLREFPRHAFEHFADEFAHLRRLPRISAPAVNFKGALEELKLAHPSEAEL